MFFVVRLKCPHQDQLRLFHVWLCDLKCFFFSSSVHINESTGLGSGALIFFFYVVEQESCDAVVLMFVFIYPAR